MTDKSKKKMGRPKIPLITKDICELENKIPARYVNLEQVLYWMNLGSTQEEIAGAQHVSVDTLSRRLKEQTGHTFAELKEKCCGTAKIKLRNNQFKLSEKNASMAIWLGKVWLGQKDVEESKNKEEILENLSSFIKACQGSYKKEEGEKDPTFSS